MGMCFSYLRGGQQAGGGVAVQMMNDVGGGAAHNDAVDKFFRTKGLLALFTQVELSLSASKLRDRDIISKVCLSISSSVWFVRDLDTREGLPQQLFTVSAV